MEVNSLSVSPETQPAMYDIYSVCVCMCVFACVSVYLCMYAYVCVHVCVCVCVHICNSHKYDTLNITSYLAGQQYLSNYFRLPELQNVLLETLTGRIDPIGQLVEDITPSSLRCFMPDMPVK